ncbi:urea ABC transporter substrate-binding protein [Thiomicrorhabdus aquaedulcis]|uniref:urea ABC transporter substrate-binding protein n=1 Tax=Thiomicrorhabdus aquaedulcis TaxID=2211106 RepID=UPI000FDB6183|nr:urea ABC transporter substrate-binding protein [Thiomicrorhabdus aquaedulcis]
MLNTRLVFIKGLVVILVFTVTFLSYLGYQAYSSINSPILVGILHAQTGTMHLSEQPVAQMTQLAIDEINAQGGILGHPIKAVSLDTQSSPQTAALLAQKLIKEHNVSALFGCWTSSCRKAVKPVVEASDHVLFYPVQYEGIETSDAIVYLGQTLNQQIKPTLNWVGQHLGQRLFLVGNDYIYPRMAHLYINDLAPLLNLSVVDEHYVPLGQTDFSAIIQAITHALQTPDIPTAPNQTASKLVILNTLNGDSNIAFFKALHAAGLHPSTQPIVSFSVSDNEINTITQQVGVTAVTGHYLASSYFDGVINSNNHQFKKRLQKQDITIPQNAATVNAYSALWLYKQAVESCGSFEPRLYKPCLAYQSYASPAGILSLDKINFNAWQASRIGQLNSQMHYDIIWDSNTPIKPENTPHTRSDQAWSESLLHFYTQWQQQWQPKDQPKDQPNSAVQP